MAAKVEPCLSSRSVSADERYLNSFLTALQAILTSVGYRSHVNRSVELREMFDLYLEAANCTDLACLRAAPVQTLIQADEAMTFNRNISEGWIGPKIGFGPHPDGDLVPNAPDLLIREGKFHKEVQKVLMANMAHDGNGVVSKYYHQRQHGELD